MSLQDFMPLLQTGGAGLLIILAGLIRIPKLEINIWTALAHVVGRALNGDVITKVDKLTSDVNQLSSDFEVHLKLEEEERVRNARQRILRFNDELLFRTKHSKEHYDDVLEDIDKYEEYCMNHPEYKNNKANRAIENIRNQYDSHLQNHDFLGLKERI